MVRLFCCHNSKGKLGSRRLNVGDNVERPYGGFDMFLVWRGWGILSVVIAAAVVALSVLILSSVAQAVGFPVEAKSKAEFVVFGVSVLVAAVANWFAGKALNGKPGRELMDPVTGQRIVLRSKHDLFFVKMEYWSVPLALLGLFLIATAFS